MLGKLAGLWPVRRAAALAVGFWDTFLRDNKVIPPVLAVIALFVFSWIVVGSFIGTPGDEPVANQNEVAQSNGGGDGSQAPAPEIENPNTDSYAAYQSKDPFRQLFATAESTTQETTTTDDGSAGQPGGGSGGSQDDNDSSDDDTTSDDGTSDDGASGDGASGDGASGDGASGDGASGDGASTGNPGSAGDGAADEQYDNGQTPREDPTDDTDDTGAQTPQTPTRPTRPSDADGDLFDSGGDLEVPNRR